MGLHRGSKVTLIYFPLCLIKTPALDPGKVASGLHGCFDAIHLWDMPGAIPGVLRSYSLPCLVECYSEIDWFSLTV